MDRALDIPISAVILLCAGEYKVIRLERWITHHYKGLCCHAVQALFGWQGKGFVNPFNAIVV